MKYKTTRKEILACSNRVVYAEYCDLQHLLSHRDPVAYTSGVYGWNFDVYEVNGLTICTGYRGMPGRRANNIREFEARARAIHADTSIIYHADMVTKLDALLSEFCAQA